jgi:hypothetical protein
MRTEQATEAHSDFDAGRARDVASAAEDERISLGDPQPVHEWAIKLGVTLEHLRELVAQVGPRPCDVQQRLAQPEVMD